ncbi:MAG: biopolymer transporter ExbD [Saprospirales bacterium]|nr:MAG: biopolymer transporter ExbD [Saprospirales bacterium]
MKEFDQFEEFSNPIREGRKQRKTSRQNVFTDMNAMVDLAFLLLTFFMLTTTMTKPNVIELVMPVPEDHERPEDVQAVRESRALTIIPFPDDELYIFRGLAVETVQRISYQPDEFRAELRDFISSTEEPMVIIKPHPESNYRNLVDIIDEMNISGVKRYAIDDLRAGDKAILAEAGIELLGLKDEVDE